MDLYTPLKISSPRRGAMAVTGHFAMAVPGHFAMAVPGHFAMAVPPFGGTLRNRPKAV